jgi:hypothetical protein
MQYKNLGVLITLFSIFAIVEACGPIAPSVDKRTDTGNAGSNSVTDASAQRIQQAYSAQNSASVTVNDPSQLVGANLNSGSSDTMQASVVLTNQELNDLKSSGKTVVPLEKMTADQKVSAVMTITDAQPNFTNKHPEDTTFELSANESGSSIVWTLSVTSQGATTDWAIQQLTGLTLNFSQ